VRLRGCGRYAARMLTGLSRDEGCDPGYGAGLDAVVIVTQQTTTYGRTVTL
jgi:hypothetical protein